MSRVSRADSPRIQVSTMPAITVATCESDSARRFRSARAMRRICVPPFAVATNPESSMNCGSTPKSPSPGFRVRKWLRAPSGLPSFTVTVKTSTLPETM